MMKTIRNIGILFTLLWLLPVSAAMAAGLPHTFTAGSPANAEDVNDNFRYVAPKNVINVNPVEGGTTTDNGTALLDALELATITAINGAPSGSNPYLVHLAPGIYDLNGASAQLHDFVYLEGSGKGATWVTSNVNLSTGATINLANNSAVRHLSVQNYNTSGTGVAIYADGVSSQAEDLEVVIAGTGIKGGLYADNSATLDINNVRVSGYPTSSTANWYGLSASSTSTVHVNDMVIDVDGLATEMVGADIQSSTAELHNIKITANNTYSTGKVYGVRVLTTADVSVQDGRIDVAGLSAEQYPFWQNGTTASLTVQHSDVLSGSGSSGSEFFLYIGGGAAKFATSRLAPEVYATPGTGTVTCAYIYNTAFSEVAGCTEAPI
jgi:hypothetical protein